MSGNQPTSAGKVTVSVLGARGMLGSDVVPCLRAAGYRVTESDLPECDITRREHVEAAIDGSDVVINCAAYTDVDGAERDPETAWAVNAAGPKILAGAAAEIDAYLVHISTDFVFDGTLARPYAPDDRPHPINVYGRTKLAGESGVLSTWPRSSVIRVQWTYGHAGRHFVSKFLARALACDELMMVDDQVGSPTWTRDVACALRALVVHQPAGIFHFAADGYATRFEVAEEILAACGLEHKTLQPCRTSDFDAPADRPLNSRFDCSDIDRLLDSPRPHWRMSLGEFLAREQGTVP